MAEVRFRSWSTILYIDELPGDIIDRIKDLHVEYCVSPVHVPGGDEKQHRHLYIGFEGKKSGSSRCKKYRRMLRFDKTFCGFAMPFIDVPLSTLADNVKSISSI